MELEYFVCKKIGNIEPSTCLKTLLLIVIAGLIFINSASVSKAAIPTPGISASAVSSSQINVSWSNVGSGITYFLIRADLGGYLYVGSSTGYSNTGLAGSTTYSYAVAACNGVTCSPWSGYVSATTQAACVGNLGAACNRNACGGSGTIQCNGSCSASAPPIYGTASCGANACGSGNTNNCTGACDSPSPPPVPGNFGAVCTSAPNACGQTNTGTIQCNGTCSAITPPNSNCPPPTPSLSASAVSSSQINVSWSNVGSGITYFLIRADLGGYLYVGSSTGYSNTGLAGSTTYSYAVAACNGVTCSPWSGYVSATTQAACTAGWKCQNTTTRGYQDSACNWSSTSFCTNGCDAVTAACISAPSYKLNSGQAIKIDEFGVCKVVTRTSAGNIFIPTKTAAEWTSFRNNATGVSFSTCTY